MKKKLAGVLFLTLLCTACSSVNNSAHQTNKDAAKKAPKHSPSYLSKEQFGDKWAFTIDHVIVECRQDAIYLYDDDGTIYPINGIAVAKYKNDPNAKDISSIQKDDEAQNKILEQINEGRPYTKAKKDLTFALNAGLKLCK